MPTSIVAASISSPEINNNSKGNSQSRVTLAEAAAAMAASNSAAGFTTGTSASGTSVAFGFSSPFLAQLMGQSAANSTQPTLDYETFVEYSQVKYAPSGAFEPPPAPPRFGQATPVREPFVVQQQAPQVSTPVSAPAVSQASVQDAPVTQAAVQAKVTPTLAPTITLAGANYAPAQKATTQPAPANVSTKAAPAAPRTEAKPSVSLISPRGVDAYSATFSRNSSNLAIEPAKVLAEL